FKPVRELVDRNRLDVVEVETVGGNFRERFGVAGVHLLGLGPAPRVGKGVAWVWVLPLLPPPPRWWGVFVVWAVTVLACYRELGPLHRIMVRPVRPGVFGICHIFAAGVGGSSVLFDVAGGLLGGQWHGFHLHPALLQLSPRMVVGTTLRHPDGRGAGAGGIRGVDPVIREHGRSVCEDVARGLIRSGMPLRGERSYRTHLGQGL